MLKILEPIILPNSKSSSPFLEDTIVVTSSGKEVPKAMIVSNITRSLNPSILAIIEALLTTKLLPIIILAIPNIISIKEVIKLNLGFSSSFCLSFFNKASDIK